jgi:hypothetical protein
MRIFLAIPLVALSACDVDRDAANDTTTIELNEAEAQNIAEDVGNTAQDIGGAIANEAEDAAAKIRNTDVDVDVNTGGGDQPANPQ